MTRTTDITSVTEHRKNLREHLDRLNKSDRPLYVTTNGQTEAVVLSARAYDELADRADMAETLAMILRSEADLKAGRARDAREAVRSIAKKHKISRKP
ncbi:MAG: type II toxin-antitoxin system Phd/YefM family antitoxin [Phycisphaeraceae bacterium]|nr:type II toxin-antitoxin system Phd/YefM family antitoxin [Phycisphaeraceae bacterium]MCW5769616.1 type II toxin-antitoxin system Phd/YefM family antitoxin [Phycisphaeraceae bacterium]